MTGAVDFVEKTNEKFDYRNCNSSGQLSESALMLLREASSFAKPPSIGNSLLPDISIAAPTARPRPGDSGANNPNMAMGNPSNATTDVANGNNYLLVKDQYVMSYNKDHKTPNWVSWQLNSDWLGSTKRTDAWSEDTSLPSSFRRAQPSDYKGSGYDRGHNVPSGDRTRSTQDNVSTFLMSNIAPQTPDNNQGPWEKLESYSRELVKQGKELYIIAGNEGSRGQISNGINIPDEFWKVIVVMPHKGMGVSDVNANTEIIAVRMPNVNGIKNDDWRKYITTVGDIERETGFDLLSALPDDIERAVSQKKFGN